MRGVALTGIRECDSTIRECNSTLCWPPFPIGLMQNEPRICLLLDNIDKKYVLGNWQGLGGS